MSNELATNATAATSAAVDNRQVREQMAEHGFFKRYRLPLILAAIALCLYAGSILYMLLGRGQIV